MSKRTDLEVRLDTIREREENLHELFDLCREAARAIARYRAENERLTEQNAILAAASPLRDSVAMLLDEMNAPNYVEIILEGTGGRRFVLTLQRQEGESPHGLRKKAEAKVDRFSAALAAIAEESCWGAHDPNCREARPDSPGEWCGVCVAMDVLEGGDDD